MSLAQIRSGAIAVRLLAGLAATLMLAAACQLSDAVLGKPSIIDLAWTSKGDIYYQTVDVHGTYQVFRRASSGARSLVSLAGVAPVLGSDCMESNPKRLFVAPDGRLGLQFNCVDSTKFVEMEDKGDFSVIGQLPAGWGNLAVVAGESLSGIAMSAVTSPSGGRCMGVQQVMNGRLAAPFPKIPGAGSDLAISPPAASDCIVSGGSIGALQPAIRRDGAYWAFLQAVGPVAHESRQDGYVWWWPANATTPIQIGQRFTGVDSLSIDPKAERIALSFAFGSDDGIVLIDLKSGAVRKIGSGTAHLVAFSPRGDELVIVNRDNDLSFLHA